MPFVAAAKNIMLDALTVTSASLHSDDPGGAGTANELAGGSPAYARKAVTFNAASAGARALSANVEFDAPAGSTVAYVGYWDSTTFRGSRSVTSEAFAGQGIYRLLASGTSLSLTD